jgi:hypothetical protein
MPHAVDEKGRCTVDVAADAAHEIAAHLVFELARLKRIAHGCFGKPELRADQKNRGDAQPALIFEQGILHFPKQPRCAGELRAFGGDLGVRVYSSVRGK